MILVTGATGRIGGEVLQLLADEGAPVRAFVRDPAKMLWAGELDIEIAEGDMAEPATIDAALPGVDRIFLCTQANPAQVELQSNVVKAAVRAGVEQIVKISARSTAHDAPTALGRWHAETEKQIIDAGLGYTHLHPTVFMQTFLAFAPSIASEGAFYAQMKDGRISIVDTRDIAAVAVAALSNAAHLGQTYKITGPEAISYEEAAQTLSTVLGKPVRYVALTPDEHRARMRASGVPEWRIEDQVKLFQMFSNNLWADVDPSVRDVAKIEPRTFAQFARDHAHLFTS